jgi:alanine dehydrogenase
MLFIDAETVRAILPISEVIRTQEEAFRGLLTHDSVHRGRIDIYVPNDNPDEYYRWGTMEGASRSLGVHAIRMKSDIISWPKDEHGNWTTEEKYCVEPGTYCGLVFLFSTRNGEPLALINEGHLQHMRVAAGAAIGLKYLAREAAEVVGMYGSGGMARDFLRAAVCVRPIRKVKIYSPTKANRELYAREMGSELEIDIEVTEDPREVSRGVDIVSTCTDTMVPFLEAGWLEAGQHLTTLGGNNWGPEVESRVDLIMSNGEGGMIPRDPEPQRFEVGRGHSPGAYIAGSENDVQRLPPPRSTGAIGRRGEWTFTDLVAGRVAGRTDDGQITLYRAGGLQGLQFTAAGYAAYAKARELGVGREVPTEWFLQDIRD